jgi:hypothetical protein
MTHPTRAIFHTLLSDFVRVSAGSADEGLYSESDLEAAMTKAEVIDFDQTVDLGGIQVGAGTGRGLVAVGPVASRPADRPPRSWKPATFRPCADGTAAA